MRRCGGPGCLAEACCAWVESSTRCCVLLGSSLAVCGTPGRPGSSSKGCTLDLADRRNRGKQERSTPGSPQRATHVTCACPAASRASKRAWRGHAATAGPQALTCQAVVAPDAPDRRSPPLHRNRRAVAAAAWRKAVSSPLLRCSRYAAGAASATCTFCRARRLALPAITNVRLLPVLRAAAPAVRKRASEASRA